MSLNKFIHIPLLKNNVKLIFFFFKVTNNHTKKSNHPKKNLNKKHVPKKSHLVKIKIKKIQKKEAMLMPKKKKSDNWQHDCPKKKKGNLAA